MNAASALRNAGVRAGLAAAVLFGVAAPLAALLLGDTGPWLMAALLYLGSGLGLLAVRRVQRRPPVRLPRADVPWMAGAVLAGGIVAPVLLMLGLTAASAAAVSLLLNAESVLTALLAWAAFRENIGRRVLLGMASIAAGALVLSWPAGAAAAGLWPTAAVLGACLCWAIDNNLTRRVSLTDASWLAATKGCVAGSVNLVLAILLGATWPGTGPTLAALLLGFACYGVSLVLFIGSLREVGTARAGAYFAVAPFAGAVLAVALGAPVTAGLLAAGALMALGVWLHLTERHAHTHTHAPIEHSHRHGDDEHHRHSLAAGPEERHRHEAITHSHPHYPDAHHRHGH